MTGERPIGSWWSVLTVAATAFFVAYPEAHALAELRLDTEIDGHRYYD